MDSFKNFRSDQTEYRKILVKDSFSLYAYRNADLNLILVTAQVDQPLLVGAVVDWNLSIDLLLFVEKIQMNITVAIICSNMQNLTQTFQ